MRFIWCGIAAEAPGVGALAPGAAVAGASDGPVPLSEVARPPIGIRFCSLGIAEDGAGAVAAGGAAAGACAQPGAATANAATAAAPIKIAFTMQPSLSP
jgi:hypothetical protein